MYFVFIVNITRNTLLLINVEKINILVKFNIVVKLS